jgi:hypothetical protein
LSKNLVLYEGQLVLLTNRFIAVVEIIDKKKRTVTLTQIDNRIQHTVKLIEAYKMIEA